MRKDKKVLIVLDDVWDILDFECIGLPYLEHEKYCKILLTSRDEKVCKNLGCNVNFQVSVLSEDEAWYLFREMSGGIVDTYDINPIASEVAKECGGLPLAIVTVGRALSNEGKSAWEDALRHLRNFQSSPFSDVGKFVYPSIELSLKFLDSREHKLFLMLCGLYPEDFDIPIESLLCHGFGLGPFKDISASWEARNRVHTLVEDLRRKFLLLDSSVPGCVKMHDIVRNVVISVAFKNAEDKFMVKYTFKSLKEEKLNEINAISLILDDTKELENGLHCPTLKILQVSSKSKEPMFWPELFFQSMSTLKVLSMKNLCIPKLPYLSQASVNLHTLQVEHCDVGDISIIGKELKHLEVLSFAHSNIKELPIEIGNLGSVRLLDLSNCNDLDIISDNILIRLSRLEELYYRIDNFPWKRNEVALNELKKISHQLKVVEIKFRGAESLVKDLDFKNLQKFWVYVDPYTDFQRSLYLDSTLLQVSGIGYQSIGSILMISQLIKKCEILVIRNVKALKNVMPQIHQIVNCFAQVKRMNCDQSELTQVEEGELSMNDKLFSSDWMQKLETILLQNCSSINVVSDTQRYSYILNGQVFPQLKELKISYLNQLTHVWSKAMHCVQGFQNLKTLTISNCDSLRHVFTPAIIRAITNIEKLEIRSCKLMEYLVTTEEDDEGGHINKEEVNIISFEKLDSLTLSGLPSIARVSANSYEIEFPSLRKLVIDDCPKLDTLFLLTAYTKQNNHFVASYSNLDGNGVSDFEENNPRPSNFQFGCTPLCSKLIRQSIKNNKINKAPSVSETKPKIELGGAPLLEDFYVNNCCLQGMDKTRIRCTPVIDGHLLPYLKSLIMKRCEKISVLLSSSSMRCLKHLEKLHILECDDLNEVVSQEESESNGEKIVFPALQHLCLRNLPNLKAFFQGPCNLDFPSLQKVDIEDCPNMELFSRGFSSTPQLEGISMEIESFSSGYIQKNDMNATIQRFKACVELQSSEMLNWTELIDKDMFGYFFEEGTINITRFHRLSMLVPFSEIQILQHVRELNASDCDSLVEVFGSVGEFTKKNDVATHYHLQKMRLEDLARLSDIWKHNITSFQNLAKINVSDCPNLRSLLSHSMARSLVQLQKIVVEDCEMMEDIITMEGESIKGGNKVKTLFPKLELLTLESLPKLKCICSGDYDYDISLCTVEVDKEFNNNDKVQISFPQLKELVLCEVPELKCFCSGAYDYDIMVSSTNECPNMTNLLHGNVIVNTPNLHNLWWEWNWDDIQTLGDLNLTIYYLHNSEKYKVQTHTCTRSSTSKCRRGDTTTQ
ncbi:NB-ARC domain disease resistance protein [Medicago truncatula]|uniref:NB-ARC domain disease resistance protein n=1 Tax=Medicago truncatula TaxID=3880 RepID=G7L4T5_MEDTR|nr:NB-ARC domain disease resistance protein [Medicago truncatula]